MHFSEVFSVMRSSDDDWFDTYLPSDSKLCVDPFLIYESHDPLWAGAHNRILDFFAMTFELIRQAKGNIASPAWKAASNLLLFPEPAEFCLGVAEGSPLGAGSGKELRKDMIDAITTSVRYGLTSVDHMEMLALLHGGMGLDRISDIVCNILKAEFIAYTQAVCARHGIPVTRLKARHVSWSEEYAKWNDGAVELPVNPYLRQPHGVLLVPEDFLKDIPVVTANDFWSYAWSNHSTELRDAFNYDVARKVPKRVKARLARRHISIVQDYLSNLEKTEHDPYPVTTDPQMLLNWYDAGASITGRNSAPPVPSSKDGFREYIRQLIDVFKNSVENQGSWELLWSPSGVPRKERVAQKLFQSVLVHYCRANDVDLSAESNAGRGPVDFKFSKGWGARALVEMKLMRNKKFWDGILAQAPQYAESEETSVAFIVAIAFTDKEMEPDNQQKVAKAAALASENNSIDVLPVIVDARRPLSASKLSATADEKSKLGDSQLDDDDNDDDEDDLEASD